MLGTIFTQLVVVCLVSFGIGTLMEWYKKKIRKDQAGIWEVRGIAFVLSFGAAALFNFTGIAYPVFATLFKNMGAGLANILNIVLYGAVIFVLQLQSDMKLVKGIIKYAAGKVSFEEIVRIISTFEKVTKVNVKTIANILLLFGLTEEKCIEVLVQAGFSHDDAIQVMNEVARALNPNATAEDVKANVDAAYAG